MSNKQTVDWHILQCIRHIPV